MATKILSVTLAATVLLLGGFHASAPAQTPSVATGQRIAIIGTLKRVGGRADPVLFAGDDRHLYTLDITRARITEPNGSLARLTPGMRAYVSGRVTASEGISVSRLQVLPAAGVQPPAALPEVTNTAEPPDLTVRGKVEALDLEHGAFVLRISTHTRIVYVTADTDVSGLGPLPADQFPVRPGRRVTVGGSLQPDGTVLAGLLTVVRDIDYQTPASRPNRVLIATVSSAANKLGRRDIKVRSADGTETRIQIPRGIPIRRGGRQISVYDLSSRDTVRVLGRIVGSDFHASRIEVLAPAPEPALENTPPLPAPAPPSRPGL